MKQYVYSDKRCTSITETTDVIKIAQRGIGRDDLLEIRRECIKNNKRDMQI